MLILDVLDGFKAKLIVPTNETFKKVVADKLAALNNNINNIHTKSESITDIFYKLLEERRVVPRRKNAIKVVIHVFKRFELYKKRTYTLNSVTDVDITQFEKFLVEGHTIFQNHPKIYEAVPETREPAKRGKNRITQMLKLLNSLFN